MLLRLLLLGLVFSGLPWTAAALEIATDTVWQGTVLVEEPVTVLAEATLLVQPGTTVRFGRNKLDGSVLHVTVHGRLIAQGTEEAPILFTAAAPAPRPGDWGGIFFEKVADHASYLRYCRIEFARIALEGRAGTMFLEDSQLRHNGTGLSSQKEFQGGAFGCEITGNDTGVLFYQNADFVLVHCQVHANRKDGVVCNLNSAPQIRSCRISDNSDAGISCLQGSSPLLTDNLIAGNGRGVHAEMRSHPEVSHNEIRDNRIGIRAEKLAYPRLFANLIVANDVGIFCDYSGYPVLRDNSIIDNRRFAIALGDHQSKLVEGLLPVADRHKVLAKDDLPLIPEEGRKKSIAGQTEEIAENIVDARENWWGEVTSAQMVAAGTAGNIDAFDDYFDRPETEYQGRKFTRDQVHYGNWLSGPCQEAGRRETSPSGVGGKVLFNGKPLRDARVHVFRDLAAGVVGEGFSFSAPTDSQGRFSLHLKPGSYILVGKKTNSPFPAAEPRSGDLFGYYGGNPVKVNANAREEIKLQLEAAGSSERSLGSEPGWAVVTGRILGPKGPAEGAVLYFYPDTSSELRGPDLFGPRGAVPGGVDAKGTFEVMVPPGKYHLVAAKRQRGAMGPLQVGDLWGFFPGNPVALAGGERLDITMQVMEKMHSRVVDQEPPKGVPGVAGTFRDDAGRPVAGVYAFAFDEAYPQGTMPPYRSQPTGEDGKFFLPLPGNGNYFFGGRSGYGGAPLPGQWHSFHGEEQLIRVEVFAETVPVTDVTLRRME